MQNPFSFDLDQSSVSQISFHTEDASPRNDRPFDMPSGLALPTSQEIQSEVNSQFIESLMICNDVDVEVELKKAKNVPEGIFKVLSMSFYDKSVSSRPNGNNYSPLSMDQNNKVLTSRPSGNLAKAIEVKSTPMSPAIRALSANTVKLTNAEPTKTSPKPEVKLFSIREKPTKIDLSPQSNSKKADLRISLGASPMGRISPQTASQTLSKEDVRYVTQSTITSPKLSLKKSYSNNMRLNTLEDKPSALIKSNSPKSSLVSRPNSKAKMNEGANLLLSSFSSRATFEAKMIGTPTLKKQSSVVKQFSLKKSVTEENPKSTPTPIGYAFDRNRIEYKMDVQRSSVNDVVYPPNLTDLHNKNTKYSKLRAQRTSQSPNHLLKVDLTKGYSYSKAHGKHANRKEGSGEQVGLASPKSLLTKKLRTNADDNEKLKGPLRKIIDYSSTTKNKATTEKFINWTVLKHRDSSPTCSFNETLESNNKSNSKAYAKIQGKEGNYTLEPQKHRSAGLAFRCKTFEI